MTLEQFIRMVVKELFGPRPVMICKKCGARVGEIFCDRSLLGEIGACEFVEEVFPVNNIREDKISI